jgi:hypothetical protein
MSLASSYTISCWVKLPSGATYGGAIMAKMRSSWSMAATCFYFGNGTSGTGVSGLYPEVVCYSNGFITSTSPIGTGAWHYLVFTHGSSGGTGAIYIDGISQTLSNSEAPTYSPDSTTYYPKIGRGNGNEITTTFNGSMDEFSMANTQRSSDWVKLCYETQRVNNSTVLVYEDYSAWKYSKKLYFNTKSSGANVSVNVVKFPVLIRLDSTTFDFTAAQDSGQDLRFAKSDGTHLYYQIDEWNKYAKAASVWVRVDTVYGSDSTHYINMYWGNYNVFSRSNGAAVFDTGNGFSAVWHLNNDPSGGTGAITDATVNTNNGTSAGTMTTSDLVNAAVGKGNDFDGTDDGISISTLTARSPITAVSVSAWFKIRVLTSFVRIAAKSYSSNTAPYTMYGLMLDSGGIDIRGELSSGGAQNIVRGSSMLDTSHYYYGTFTYDGTTLKLYLNGTQELKTTAITGTIDTISMPVTIGMSGFSADYFNGIIDEVRISRVARSADWIKLCYQNQKAGQSLVVFNNEDYSTWTYSKKVNINTSQSGAAVSSLVQKFPVIIRFTDSTFAFSQAQDDGRDIRFSKLDGTRLPYEIERWDRINKLAEMWVLVDSVKANSGTQFVRMYWGKTGVASMSSPASVFDTASGFAGEWHLNETPSAGSASILDETINSYNGTPTGMTSSNQVDGIVGKGLSFDGSTSYITLPTISTNFTGGITVSAWMNYSSFNSYSRLIDWSQSAAKYNYDEIAISNTSTHDTISFGLQNGATDTSILVGGYFSAGSWVYLSCVWDGSTMLVYKNGILAGSKTGITSILSSVSRASCYIGKSNWSGDGLFNGYIDELQVSRVGRSADWVSLCYKNQKPGQTLVDLDDYDQWSYSKKNYINTSSLGLSGNVVKFPLLVRIDTTMICFNQARGSGQDLRFSKADGTHLNYEIEKWDSAGKSALVWVLVDTVFQSSSTQYIKMYWGKSDAISKSGSSAVFSSSNNFTGVWHLSEESSGKGSSGSGLYKDATENNNGDDSISNSSQDGIIGNGHAFTTGATNSGDYIALRNPVMSLTANAFTVSCWVKLPSGATYGGAIMNKRNSSWVWGSTCFYFGDGTINTGVSGLYPEVVACGNNFIVSSSPVGTGAWHYLVFTHGTAISTGSIYIDGVAQSLSYNTLANTYTDSTSYLPKIGNGNGNGNEITTTFNGSMDEFSMANTQRSSDWIKLCYYTQKQNQTVTTADSSADAFLKLKFIRYGAANLLDTLDSCAIATSKWTLKFSRLAGGGISWLSPDSMGTGTNQLDSNLFYILTNSNRSDTGLGRLQLLDSNCVVVRLRQSKTIGGQPYTIEYTVPGSGRVYIRASTYASSALSPTGGLEFRIAGNSSSNITNTASSATASSCSMLLHSDAGSGRIDPCLSLFENWSQADNITGTSSSKYYGIKSSTWSLPSMRSQAWEFMLDVAHRNWNDTTGTGARTDDYRNPDSLLFYAGTQYLQKAWECQLAGHWTFEEGSGDTVFDVSGSNNYGVRTTGTTWTWAAGKWGRCISLAGSCDSVKIADNTGFNGASGFSICAWVKPTSTMTSASTVFKKFGANGYIFGGGTGGVAQLKLNGNTFTGRTSVGNGTWYHLGVVYIKNSYAYDTVKIFINGKPDTIITGASYSFDASSNSAYIGGYNGLLDDLRFYGRSLSDADMKAIYQSCYDAGRGTYLVRSDNNNTLHFAMDGGTAHRYYPVFELDNYWSTTQPSPSIPYVYVNGVKQTYNKDYIVALDDKQNKLKIGFNRTINADSTRIYISGNDTLSSTITTAMPRMTWGSYSSPTAHFYVKNFTGNIFGSSSANQYYLDFKMSTDTVSSVATDGEVYRLKTSKLSYYGNADTTSTNNLVPKIYNNGAFGTYVLKIGSTWLKTGLNVTAIPSYSVAESSDVRVVFRLGSRIVKSGSDSCRIITQYTMYPMGQIFKYDSIYVPSAKIDTICHDVCQIYVSSGYGTIYPTNYGSSCVSRGGIYGATALQDMATAFLSLKNTNVVVASPIDTVSALNTGSRIGSRFVDKDGWVQTDFPYQSVFYIDLQRATLPAQSSIDSICKGVQFCTGAASTSRLIANGAGSTVLTSSGDVNGDGFNEKEGAYIYAASSANTAHFKLTANGDTCRFYPAFRITNYTATSIPQYVYVDSVAKIRGYGFNAYVKPATNELVLQLNQKICSTADIYISFDQTLAVTMADFCATPGDGRVKLQWNTESEENNLGFYIYRRIPSNFLDSLSGVIDSSSALSDTADDPDAASLIKNKIIGFSDTVWYKVNNKIIYGATSGVSYGERKYVLFDNCVHNGVKYEYKIVSVDYKNNHSDYSKYAEAVPHRIVPQMFALHGNFPNPFRRLTCLKYELPIRTKVMINVYDIRGRLVRHLVKPDNTVKAGYYQVLWDCRDDRGSFMASGPYIYRLTAKGFVSSRVMILIK